MTNPLLEQLSGVIDATGMLVGAVDEAQWSNPTPCSDWDVRHLVGHVVGGNYVFASRLSAQAPPDDPPSGWPDAALAGAYRDSAGALLAGFSQPGVLERIVEVPIGAVPGAVALHLRITELLVHGWDLSRATGRPVDFPDDVAEQELGFTQGLLAAIPPERRPFAPPQPVAEDAPAIDRLVACLGRQVD